MRSGFASLLDAGRPMAGASGDGSAEAAGLRRTYLVALTYPLWHLAAPEGARDPWWIWWLVAGSFAAVAGLSLVHRWVAQRLSHLLPLCSWLVTLHLYALAAWNEMQPFFVVGSVMAVITTVASIRSRPGLIAYLVFLTVLTATLLAFDPSATKLAYWGGILTVMPLSYVRLDHQLRREALARDVATELEERVERRTRALRQVNQRLQEEISQRKRLEGKLRFSHKMEVLGRIAGGLAHDFNNLLTTVGIYAELVLEGLPPDSPVRRDAEQIQKTTRQASALTQQLLAFNRGSAEARRIDLNDAVLEVSSMVRGILPESIAFEFRLADRPLCVRADPDQIARVAMNLILNARDAMPDGGRLRVAVEPVRGSLPEALSGASASGYALLSVADTGHGMDEETLSHAFEPFFTRKPAGRGTGLGLSIVYGIVEQGGGHVRAESRPGEGTRFEVYWPLDGEAAEETEEPAALLPRESAAERILLVEDEDELRHVLDRVLRQRGYEVVYAADGDEALQLVESAERGFDLVVSDVVMPRMNGYELALRLRREHPRTKVLLMSGQPNHPTLGGQALPPGVDMLAKPFDLRDLAGKVRSVLESGPQG